MYIEEGESAGDPNSPSVDSLDCFGLLASSRISGELDDDELPVPCLPVRIGGK